PLRREGLTEKTQRTFSKSIYQAKYITRASGFLKTETLIGTANQESTALSMKASRMRESEGQKDRAEERCKRNMEHLADRARNQRQQKQRGKQALFPGKEA